MGAFYDFIYNREGFHRTTDDYHRLLLTAKIINYGVSTRLSSC